MSAQIDTATTAQECVTRGTELLSQAKRKEALEYFNKAITLDPKCAVAYGRKGQILVKIGNKTEGRQCMEKGVELDPNHPDARIDKSYYATFADAFTLLDEEIRLNPNRAIAYAYKGTTLLSTGKYQEGLVCIEKAIELNPLDPAYPTSKSDLLRYLGKFDDALAAANKALALDATFGLAYLSKGLALHESGKYQQAIECYEEGIKHNPNLGNLFNNLALALDCLGQNDRALELIDKAIAIEPRDFQLYRSKALFLIDFERWQEAVDVFDKAIELRPSQAYLWCRKAEALNKLGKSEGAMECFKKANELINTVPSSTALLQPSFINWIKTTVKSALDLQAVSKEAETELQRLQTTSNAAAIKFAEKMKNLSEQKKEINNKIMNQVGANNTQEAQRFKSEIDILKEEFQKQLDLVKKELSNTQEQVKVIDKKVNNLELKLEDLKEEVSTKMDDFRKKLDLALGKLDMNAQQTAAINEYFNAFVGTFASLFVTSQVVESGQVQLDAGSDVASVLSMAASFAPFFGDALSKTISSIGEFLQTKEMKTNARKMLSLAADSNDLSQLVGGVVYDVIIENAKKRTQITEVTDDDMEEKSQNMFEKIRAMCQKIQEKIDIYLYTRLYKTAAAQLGHMDANKLVEYWMKDDHNPFGIKKAFVKILAEDLEKKENSPGKGTPQVQQVAKGERTACCNMF